ncbi:MAG: hypothetical protein ABII88_11425 [Candidatus Omnitrophota bacterium]
MSKKPPKPTDHDFWFINNVRHSNSINKLNKRQERILKKVRLWEKYHGALDQKEWKF